MTNKIVQLGFVLLIVVAVMAGCAGPESVAKRGLFGDASCKKSDRVDVPSGALYAIYFDGSGNEVGPAIAEDLSGTNKNKMCPTPEADTGACPAGYCARPMGGKTYCLRC